MASLSTMNVLIWPYSRVFNAKIIFQEQISRTWVTETFQGAAGKIILLILQGTFDNLTARDIDSDIILFSGMVKEVRRKSEKIFIFCLYNGEKVLGSVILLSWGDNRIIPLSLALHIIQPRITVQEKVFLKE